MQLEVESAWHIQVVLEHMTAWRYSGALRWALLPALAVVTAVRNLLNRVAQAAFRCTRGGCLGWSTHRSGCRFVGRALQNNQHKSRRPAEACWSRRSNPAAALAQCLEVQVRVRRRNGKVDDRTEEFEVEVQSDFYTVKRRVALPPLPL